jgi:hypothetical protein
MLNFEIEGGDRGVERIHVRHAGGRTEALRTLREILPTVERLDQLVRPVREAAEPRKEPAR